jgi:hypothetical protein
LLASNNVYSSDVVINSASSLETAKALGNKLNILNADISIDQDANLNAADLQLVVDKLKTVVGDVRYVSSIKTTTTATFTNLGSASNIYIDVPGAVSFPALENVTNFNIGTAMDENVTSMDLPKLTKVTDFVSGQTTTFASGAVVTSGTAVADKIALSKATAIHLTSLVSYDAGTLTLEGATDFTLKMSALTSTNHEGVKQQFTLVVDGAKEINIPGLIEGSVTADNTERVILTKFEDAVSATKAEYVELGAMQASFTGGASLKDIKFTGALNSASTPVGPVVTLTAPTALATAVIAGKITSVDFTGSGIVDATVSADASGAVTFSGNDDLTSVKVSGTTSALTINDADELVSVDLEHTSAKATAGSSLIITGNAILESLKADKVNNVGTLTITGNDELATVSFDALKALPSTTSVAATVTISGNDLSATSATEATAGTTAVPAGTGTYVSESGLSDLKTYLGLAAARAGNDYVRFDTLDAYYTLANAKTEYGAYVDDSTSPYHIVMKTTAAVPDTTPTVRETRSIVWEALPNVALQDKALGTGEKVTITAGGVTESFGDVSVDANDALTVNAVKDAINAYTGFGSGVTVTAARDAYAKSYQYIKIADSDGVQKSATAAVASTSGTLYVQLGSVTATSAAVFDQASDVGELYSTIASTLSGTVVNGTKYYVTATTIGSVDALMLQRLITNTSNIDYGVNTSAFPAISITATNSGVLWSSSTNNIASAASDYYISYQKADRNGLRVTIKNNSTSVALASTETATLVAGSSLGTSSTTLVSGTTMVGSKSYEAAFSDITTTGSGTAASSTLRNTWL